MYSPISPINSKIMPEKKQITTAIDDQPSGTDGLTILLTKTAITPTSPASENRYPSLVARRSGTTENPMMFDHSPISFFNV